MGIFRAPNIPTNSLVFCVDPANHKSYSEGSTAYDIAGGRDEGSNALVTLSSINSASSILNDGVGRRWSLNGTNQYWRINSSPAGLQPDITHVTDTGYTVNAWIIPDTLSQTQGIFSNDGEGNSTYYGITTFINSSGYLGIRTGDGGGTNPANRITVLETSGPLSASRWAFVSFVLFSVPAKWRIFVNGSTLSMGTPSGTATSIAYTGTNAGAIGLRGNDYFDGGIGGLWVYNRALSQSEINTIYEKTKFKYSDPA